jgi:hypothetical protein
MKIFRVGSKRVYRVMVNGHMVDCLNIESAFNAKRVEK